MGQRLSGAAKSELIDVRHAAALVGRHPETIRRWVWSGRLAASRRGRRLMVAQADVEAVARRGVVAISLREWVDRADAARTHLGKPRSRHSAADLVIEDRQRRSGAETSRARR